MNPLQTLLLVWAAGGVLSRDGDCLHLEARKGAIPLQLLDVLRDNKIDLLPILPPVHETCPEYVPRASDG
jgi:hypothetical protein